MKKIVIIILFFLGASCYDVHAQDSDAHTQGLLDTLALDAQKTYRSINEALLVPDSVYKLDLSKKKLKILPEEIRAFKNLQVLKISRNDLKELPEWIGEFANLQHLEASNNKLKALPDSIGNLYNLIFLGLNRNLIEKLPHEMGRLKNLEVLEMWDNELGSVPEEMRNLRNLRVFELRGILFSDEDQRQISDLLPDTEIYFSPSCNCKN